MAVKLRLQRKGRRKAPFYHIVAADARAPRDGRFIEKVGTYNPLTVPATIELNHERAFYWVMNGAEPTDTVAAILRFKGVMFHKHLAIGVKKGAITQEKADRLLAELIEKKEKNVNSRREQVAKQKAEYIKKVDGVAKPIKVVAPPVVETVVEEAAEVTTPIVETVAETAVEAVATVTETTVEVVAEATETVAEVTETVVETVTEVMETAVAETATETVTAAEDTIADVTAAASDNTDAA